MSLIFLILIFIVAISVSSFGYNLYKIIRILLCIKVPARIIHIDGNTNKWGIYKFHYLLIKHSNVLKLERNVMPLKTIFSPLSVHSYLGKKVFVPYDEKHKRLLEDILIVYIRLFLSAILVVVWSCCCLVLYKVMNM